ncbi:hypothetical protein J6590_101233 [Homalodisca vitripennis]|nr:hypothetical protein J6590_101233 [Homalodisca vitripennis]
MPDDQGHFRSVLSRARSFKAKLAFGATPAKKPFCNTSPGVQRLNGDIQTITNGRASGLLARTGSLSGHPSKQQPRSTLLDSVISR